MENRKEIQKAQKAPKPKKKTFWATIVAAKKVGFFGFPRKKLVFPRKTNFSLGKSWFLEVVGSKNQLFPTKKLWRLQRMAFNCFLENKLFPRKKLVFEAQAFEKPNFFLRKSWFFLENPTFS